LICAATSGVATTYHQRKFKIMATKKTKAKTAAVKKASAALTASTVITFKAAREKTGPKTELLKLVPRKGTITLKQLQEKAESEGIKPARVPKFIASLAKYGYVDLA
jgi:hypothetical protein